MRTYGQYCPIARGAEIFAERWTPLIVRNLHLGCETFGEILEGAPGLSNTLLAQRLHQLEHLGIVPPIATTPRPVGDVTRRAQLRGMSDRRMAAMLSARRTLSVPCSMSKGASRTSLGQLSTSSVAHATH